MIPERDLNPPEPRPAARCECCGEDMYDGEDAYCIDGKWYCTECVKPSTVERQNCEWSYD